MSCPRQEHRRASTKSILFAKYHFVATTHWFLRRLWVMVGVANIIGWRHVTHRHTNQCRWVSVRRRVGPTSDVSIVNMRASSGSVTFGAGVSVS